MYINRDTKMKDIDSDTSESEFVESDSSSNEILEKQKLSWFEKRKKGVVSKAATSSIGKALFKKYADKETLKLLKAIKSILRNTHKNSKVAKDTHKHIIKLSVKVLMLYDQKKLKDSDFNSLTYSFRRFCSSIRNHYQARSFNENAVERICNLGESLCLGIHNILKPYVKKKTLERIKYVSNILCTKHFIKILPEQTEFPEIVMVLSHYLTISH